MTTTTPLALLLLTLGSAACTAEAASPLPAKPTDRASRDAFCRTAFARQ